MPGVKTQLEEIGELYDKATAESEGEPAAEVESETEPIEAAPEVETEQPEGEESEESEGRARDESGRFAKGKPDEKPAKSGAQGAAAKAPPPKAAAPAPAAVAGASAAPAAPPAPAVPDLRAPQSWKPAVRELAAKLPPEFRPLLEEVNRVELATKKALSEGAEDRKTARAFREVAAPFDAVLRQNGVDPVQAAGTFMQWGVSFQTGNAQQKAALLANLIKQGNVSVDDLASALDGKGAPPTQQPDINRLVQQEVERRMGGVAKARMDEVGREVASEIAAFSKTHEWVEDLREDMGKLISAGAAADLQEAYDLALKLPKNAEIAGIESQRKAAKDAAAKAAADKGKRAAATSIKTEPGLARGGKPRTQKDEIAELYDRSVAGDRL